VKPIKNNNKHLSINQLKFKNMNMEFNYYGSPEVKQDLENLKKFKERYLDYMSGRREINDDGEELERLKFLLNAEETIENLYESLVEAEKEEEIKIKC
jgi:hypothetical protein